MNAPAPQEDTRSYYEILGIDPKEQDAAAIKRAYRSLALRLHPDNKDTGDEGKFKLLGEAWAVISNPDDRAAYDRFLSEGGRGQFNKEATNNWESIFERMRRAAMEADRKEQQFLDGLNYGPLNGMRGPGAEDFLKNLTVEDVRAYCALFSGGNAGIYDARTAPPFVTLMLLMRSRPDLVLAAGAEVLSLAQSDAYPKADAWKNMWPELTKRLLNHALRNKDKIPPGLLDNITDLPMLMRFAHIPGLVTAEQIRRALKKEAPIQEVLFRMEFWPQSLPGAGWQEAIMAGVKGLRLDIDIKDHATLLHMARAGKFDAATAQKIKEIEERVFEKHMRRDIEFLRTQGVLDDDLYGNAIGQLNKHGWVSAGYKGDIGNLMFSRLETIARGLAGWIEQDPARANTPGLLSSFFRISSHLAISRGSLGPLLGVLRRLTGPKSWRDATPELTPAEDWLDGIHDIDLMRFFAECPGVIQPAALVALLEAHMAARGKGFDWVKLATEPWSQKEIDNLVDRIASHSPELLKNPAVRATLLRMLQTAPSKPYRHEYPWAERGIPVRIVSDADLNVEFQKYGQEVVSRAAPEIFVLHAKADVTFGPSFDRQTIKAGPITIRPSWRAEWKECERLEIAQLVAKYGGLSALESDSAKLSAFLDEVRIKFSIDPQSEAHLKMHYGHRGEDGFARRTTDKFGVVFIHDKVALGHDAQRESSKYRQPVTVFVRRADGEWTEIGLLTALQRFESATGARIHPEARHPTLNDEALKKLLDSYGLSYEQRVALFTPGPA